MPRLDEYELIGELHDLFLGEEVWSSLRPALQDAFGSLPETALVADIGAGTGLSTRLLAGCFPGRLAAVEPSALMRTGLLTRISDDAALAARVSVIAGTAPSALNQLPGPLDGFLCAHMLGHLESTERGALFRALSRRLAPGGVGIVTAPRLRPEPSGEPMVHTRRLGGLDYVARYHHQDAEDGTENTPWQRYEVRDGETLLRSLEASSRWRTVTQGQLAEEARPAELHLESLSDGLAALRMIRRTAPPSRRRH
ncbi:class I SAM-dependent methyltransferase [Nesterenkonia sp. HG001]|uniref:class I SAM-dependent methyltransferase n=1 Tax=Nesterenkonia sp. HG001 TaxID=2983207 RepID=UPI002AC68141|nr:class I SAM-dependent methyltransferase [Nesterenkonia sp. HG001]MDZ5078839.1 class I SAM-dependent methyltransferase [Nesterenkonia sp. HG001]